MPFFVLYNRLGATFPLAPDSQYPLAPRRGIFGSMESQQSLWSMESLQSLPCLSTYPL